MGYASIFRLFLMAMHSLHLISKQEPAIEATAGSKILQNIRT